MIRYRWSQLIVLLLLGCMGCPHTVTVPPVQELAAYQTAIDAFLGDANALAVVNSPSVQHFVLYVPPTFKDTVTPIPPVVHQHLVTHPTLQAFTPVETEHVGGLIITLAAIGADPAVATVYGSPSPTIHLLISVSGNTCGAAVSVGYRLSTVHNTWRADRYVTGLC